LKTNYYKTLPGNYQIQIEISTEIIPMINYNIIYQQNINSLFPLIFTNEKCRLVTTEGITFGNEKKNDVLLS
jgi:hypothetical protein